VGLLGGPLWGALSDRFGGSPKVLLASGGVAVAGVALVPFATEFAPILAANLLIGAGTAGLLPILDARALESSGAERAGWGPLRAWGSAGWVASSLMTGLAIDAWGLGIIFVVAAAGFAAAAMLASGLARAVHLAAERPLRAALRVFATWTLALFLIGMLFANASMSAGLDFLTPRFKELAAPAGLIGLSWALAAAVEVPVMLLFPELARRFGGTRLLVAGTVVLALRTGLTAVVQDPMLLVLGSGLGGVGYALFTVGGVTYVSRHVPPALAATGQGIFQGVSLGLSGVLAAAAGGIVAGSLGVTGMFALAAGVGFAAAVVVAVAVLPDRRR
jgi:PPP family 3-phenylpropionic acid transporter